MQSCLLRVRVMVEGECLGCLLACCPEYEGSRRMRVFVKITRVAFKKQLVDCLALVLVYLNGTRQLENTTRAASHIAGK